MNAERDGVMKCAHLPPNEQRGDEGWWCVVCLRDRVKKAEAKLERAREALREIARGKSQEDCGCLASEWLVMAGRLVRIARAALSDTEVGP